MTGGSKQEAAYEYVRERIISGVYGAGYRLVIDDIARELGTSAIPVREAIRRLEAEGLVAYQRNTGARVISPDPQAVVEILSVLAVLEGYATAEAAPHLGEADFAQLEETTAAMADALASGDPLEFSRLNREFHAAIYRHCPNRYLIETIERAWESLDRVRSSVFVYARERGHASVAEHRELIRQLRAGAPLADVQELVRRHKLATVQAFQASPGWRDGSAGDRPSMWPVRGRP